MNALDRFKIIGRSTLVVLAIAVQFLAGVGAINYGVSDGETLFAVVGTINILYGIVNVIKAWNTLSK